MSDQLTDTKDTLPGDEPLVPVEIEVEAEGEGEGQPAEAAAPPPAPKKTPGRKEAAVIAAREEARLAREEADRFRAEAAAARAEAEKAKSEAAIATKSGMDNYAARVRADAEAAQKELEAAYASNDPALIAAANRKVAKVAAAEADVEAWEASVKSQPAAEQPQPQQQVQQPQQQIVIPSEPTREFFETNPWFHPMELDARGVPTGRPNPDFDAEMHDAAMLEHRKIMRQVNQGKLDKSYIESPEYFARITEKMRSEFPDAFEDEADPPPARRTPQMQKANQPVAPASRGPAAQPNRPSTKITLDGETAAFVRSLVDNGAMRYPDKHPKRGQPMSYEDGYREYARQQKLIPQQSAN